VEQIGGEIEKDHVWIVGSGEESVIEDFQSLCVHGRIHGRTHGCKWRLFEVREGKYKREHGGAQVVSGGRECAGLLHVLLKLMLI
jgi:hypothetical protein